MCLLLVYQSFLPFLGFRRASVPSMGYYHCIGWYVSQFLFKYNFLFEEKKKSFKVKAKVFLEGPSHTLICETP